MNEKSYLLICNESTNEKIPDGNGNWVDKVITRVLAGTLDSGAVEAMLTALEAYLTEQKDPEKRARTMINSEVRQRPERLEVSDVDKLLEMIEV